MERNDLNQTVTWTQDIIMHASPEAEGDFRLAGTIGKFTPAYCPRCLIKGKVRTLCYWSEFLVYQDQYRSSFWYCNNCSMITGRVWNPLTRQFFFISHNMEGMDFIDRSVLETGMYGTKRYPNGMKLFVADKQTIQSCGVLPLLFGRIISATGATGSSYWHIHTGLIKMCREFGCWPGNRIPEDSNEITMKRTYSKLFEGLRLSHGLFGIVTKGDFANTWHVNQPSFTLGLKTLQDIQPILPHEEENFSKLISSWNVNGEIHMDMPMDIWTEILEEVANTSKLINIGFNQTRWVLKATAILKPIVKEKYIPRLINGD